MLAELKQSEHARFSRVDKGTSGLHCNQWTVLDPASGSGILVASLVSMRMRTMVAKVMESEESLQPYDAQTPQMQQHQFILRCLELQRAVDLIVGSAAAVDVDEYSCICTTAALLHAARPALVAIAGCIEALSPSAPVALTTWRLPRLRVCCGDVLKLFGADEVEMRGSIGGGEAVPPDLATDLIKVPTHTGFLCMAAFAELAPASKLLLFSICS
eukprot:SAG31_NODE_4447_length_3223_cov_2.050576_2_plen_215_part_00